MAKFCPSPSLAQANTRIKRRFKIKVRVRQLLEETPSIALLADHLDGVLFPHRVEDPRTFCSWSSFAAYQQDAFADRVRALVDEWGS